MIRSTCVPGAVFCLAVSPAAVLADFGTKDQIDIRVRLLGSEDPFVNHLSLARPTLAPVDLEVGVFYFRSAGSALATAIHSIVGSPYSPALGDLATILDRPDSVLHPDGRLGTFNSGGQFQVVYHTGTAGIDANRFRIGSHGNINDAPAGGISIHQRSQDILGTAFDTSDGTFAYHFRLTMACAADGSRRTMTIDAPTDRVDSYRAYGVDGIYILPLITLPTSDPATISLTIPAPGVLAGPMLLALTAFARRRPGR